MNSTIYAARVAAASIVPATATRNRFELFDAMVNRRPINLGGTVGHIMAIELEDGSGENFNVRFQVRGVNHTVFVRNVG